MSASGGKTFTSVDPATERPLAEVAKATEADVEKARRDLGRTERLARSNVSTPTELADSRTLVAQGIAALEMARNELVESEALRRTNQQAVGYTEIRAVFDGRAGRSPLSPGNVVGPDTGVLVTVVREDPIRVTFPVTQRELLRVRRAGTDVSSDAVQVRVRLPVFGDDGEGRRAECVARILVRCGLLAACRHDANVHAVPHAVGLERAPDGLRQRRPVQPEVQPDAGRAREQAIQVLVEERQRAPVQSQALSDAVAGDEAAVEDRHSGLRARHQRAVEVDEDAGVARIRRAVLATH